MKITITTEVTEITAVAIITPEATTKTAAAVTEAAMEMVTEATVTMEAAEITEAMAAAIIRAGTIHAIKTTVAPDPTKTAEEIRNTDRLTRAGTAHVTTVETAAAAQHVAVAATITKKLNQLVI